MRIMLTGASGFVGAAILDELLARGHSVSALAHRRPIAREHVQSFQGGLFSMSSLIEAMRDCDAVIHLVGIIFEDRPHGVTFDRIHIEGTRHVVQVAQQLGIKRLIHMSALGTRPGAISRYHQTKFAAEEIVRSSDLEWTIFRPSLIHGPGGEFTKMESAWVRGKAPPYYFMPYFARGLLGRSGASRIQPIYVKDLARAFVDSLSLTRTIGEVYLLAGPDIIDWPTMHRICAKEISGAERRVIGIPAWYARLLTRIIPAKFLPFNIDQVQMSQEDSICNLTKFQEDFGWRPQGFAATLRSYAEQLL